MTVEIPEARPRDLIELLEGYDRVDIFKCSTSDGTISFCTTVHENGPQRPERVMKDLYGPMNLIGYGYTVTCFRRIRSPSQGGTPYKERDHVYRITLEPLAKLLVYSQAGHYLPHTGWIDHPPGRP